MNVSACCTHGFSITGGPDIAFSEDMSDAPGLTGPIPSGIFGTGTSVLLSVKELLGKSGDSGLYIDILGTPPREQPLTPEAASGTKEFTKLWNTLGQEFEQLFRLRHELSKAKTAEARQVVESQISEKRESLYANYELVLFLNGIDLEAWVAILSDGQLLNRFKGESGFQAFVVSIDVRRSTELMLKANDESDFADFMAYLCAEIVALLKSSFGIVDKFTGDGVLAYFPMFFAGDDAGYRALLFANQAHEAFDRLYRTKRDNFKSIPLDVGLGIGVDFGTIKLKRVNGSLTVIGHPVVFACRFASCAKRGETYLNHAAYVQLAKYGLHLKFLEARVPLKHEQDHLAYSLQSIDRSRVLSSPDWQTSGVKAI